MITYWMVGFQAALPRFLCYSATMVLASLVAESYILLCGSITTSGEKRQTYRTTHHLTTTTTTPIACILIVHR